MDTFARGLLNVEKIMKDGLLEKMVTERYESFSSEIGKKIEAGTATLEELEQFVQKHGEPTQRSGQQELYEGIFNRYL